MLGRMPDVHVTTNPTPCSRSSAVIGALAIVAVVVSLWAARFADAPSASPALPYQPTAPARQPTLPVPTTQPAQSFVASSARTPVSALRPFSSG